MSLRNALRDLEAATAKRDAAIAALNEVAEVDKAYAEAKAAAIAAFNADKVLQTALKALENSSDYTFDEFGELCAWVRYAAPEEYLTDTLRPIFEEYLEYVRIDTKHKALLNSVGSYIQINEDGDVFNCDFGINPCIVHAREYTDETGRRDIAKRNALIEEWMETNGYYPGVFAVSRYGDVRLVDTRAHNKTK